VARSIEASLDEQTVADTLPDGAPFAVDILLPPAQAAPAA
jgi:hypothetical protein